MSSGVELRAIDAVDSYDARNQVPLKVSFGAYV